MTGEKMATCLESASSRSRNSLRLAFKPAARTVKKKVKSTMSGAGRIYGIVAPYRARPAQAGACRGTSVHRTLALSARSLAPTFKASHKPPDHDQIGRAACRERVCRYV